jgi:hypothetical protein
MPSGRRLLSTFAIVTLAGARLLSVPAPAKTPGQTPGPDPSVGQRLEPRWPRLYIKDADVRDAVSRALDGAAERLNTPQCQVLLSEFADRRGRPLRDRLVDLNLDLNDYLRALIFEDGERQRRCSEQGVLAFTTIGGRTIFVCGRTFARAWRQDRAEVRATVIHEWLHTLGLGENPPTPRQITYRVKQVCW